LLRRFWLTHRNPKLIFPNRHGGLKGASCAKTPLDRGGVQITLDHPHVHLVMPAAALNVEQQIWRTKTSKANTVS